MSIKTELSDTSFKNRIDLPSSLDQNQLKDIMIYRALGFTQEEIAGKVEVSQKTVSRYLQEVKNNAEEEPPKAVFYGLFVSMFSEKLIDMMTLLFELTEDN